MQFDAIHAIMVEKGFVKKSADLFDADGNLLIEDADDDDMDDDDMDDDDYDIDDDDEYDMDDDDMDDDSDDGEDDFVEYNEVTGEEL